VEASALPAPAAVARTRTSIGAPLLRLRSDEQLVALFRAGHDDAFRVIHDRYRQRLFAYTRQMLPHRQDAEDALQDIFVRAYAGLRANDRELALRAWLYRVAHNRCIDELRRPSPPPPEVLELLRSPVHDPIDEADRRESLRRLIADVRRLPEQQRSALLMRELGGMSYADMAGALGVTVPAVKSLLVRARLALGQALEARDTACSDIREALILSHDRGLRPNATARRHMRDCTGCREFRHQLRGVSRRLGALVPTLGPVGVLANVLGIGGAGGSAAGGALAAGAGAGAGTGSAVVGVGAISAGATHVATLLAAAVVTAGGAVELQHTIAPPAPRHHQHARAARIAPVSHHVVQQTAASVTYSSADAPVESAPAAASSQPLHPQTQITPVAKTPSTGVPTTVTTSTTTVTVPIKLKSQATGGTSATTPSGGGATPSGTGARSGPRILQPLRPPRRGPDSRPRRVLPARPRRRAPPAPTAPLPRTRARAALRPPRPERDRPLRRPRIGLRRPHREQTGR
jgi:RNA polymerase sigma factor (sigma-70 family)